MDSQADAPPSHELLKALKENNIGYRKSDASWTNVHDKVWGKGNDIFTVVDFGGKQFLGFLPHPAVIPPTKCWIVLEEYHNLEKVIDQFFIDGESTFQTPTSSLWSSDEAGSDENENEDEDGPRKKQKVNASSTPTASTSSDGKVAPTIRPPPLPTSRPPCPEAGGRNIFYIAGHSGTGKSVGAWYLLLRRLSAGLSSMFCLVQARSEPTIQFFCAEGVYDIPYAVNRISVSRALRPENYLFFDAGQTQESPPPWVVRSKAPVIQPTSFLTMDHKVEGKIYYYVYPPTEIEFLCSLNQLQFPPPTEVSRDFLRKYGPQFRPAKSIHNQGSMDLYKRYDLQLALDMLSYESVQELVTGRLGAQVKVSPFLFLTLPGQIFRDQKRIRIVTPHVRDLIALRFNNLDARKYRLHYGLTSGESKS